MAVTWEAQRPRVMIDNLTQAHPVRRGSWYYLVGSAANCCAGPTTGYSVFAGRSNAQPARSSTRTGFRC